MWVPVAVLFQITHTWRRMLPVSIRCNQQRAAHANPSKQKTNSMPRSLTNAHRRELKKVTHMATEAEQWVEALNSEKQTACRKTQRLCGRLGATKCADKGPCRAFTLKARPDKCEDIEIAKLKLQVIIDELADAQASLESILRVRDCLKTFSPQLDSPKRSLAREYFYSRGIIFY